MLAVRTQAIDGARTCTLLDSQHCRLLPSQIAPTAMAMPKGGRGFYVRAEHASLPPHASDMLTTCPGNWWCGDLHPTRFTALSAAPVLWRLLRQLSVPKLIARSVFAFFRGTLFGDFSGESVVRACGLIIGRRSDHNEKVCPVVVLRDGVVPCS